MSLASTVTKSAARAVKAYGAKGTLTHVTPGGYDPTTGTTTGAVTTVTPCSAVLDSTSLKTLGYKFGDGLVQAGDVLALVAGILPVAGDILAVATGSFVVISSRPTFLGDAVVVTDCLVRR